jgi:RNA recognition motif-containing protein
MNDFPPEQKVHVTNLPEGVTWKDLQAHFNQAGKTKWAEKWKNVGAVAYGTVQEANNAIAMLNGSQLGDCVIQADFWKAKEKLEGAPEGAYPRAEGANPKKRPAPTDWSGGMGKKPMMLPAAFAKKVDPTAQMMNNPMMAQMMGLNPQMAMMMAMQQGGGDFGMGFGMGKGQGKGFTSAFKVTMDQINQLAPECKVFVAGFSEQVNWKRLNKHFEDFGHKPALCETMRNCKGVVAYNTAAEAFGAMSAMNGTLLDGFAIECSPWQSKKTQ